MKLQTTSRKFCGAILAVFISLACIVPSHAEQNTPVFITVGLKYAVQMSGATDIIVVTVLEASNQWIKVRDGNGKVLWLNTSLANTIAEAK